MLASEILTSFCAKAGLPLSVLCPMEGVQEDSLRLSVQAGGTILPLPSQLSLLLPYASPQALDLQVQVFVHLPNLLCSFPSLRRHLWPPRGGVPPALGWEVDLGQLGGDEVLFGLPRLLLPGEALQEFVIYILLAVPAAGRCRILLIKAGPGEWRLGLQSGVPTLLS